MKILIKNTNKIYNLVMKIWQDCNWSEDMSEDIILDYNFKWNHDADAYEMTGSLDNLKEYLKDWEHFNTEDDHSFYDEETRRKLSDEEIRYYELEEIG